MISEEEARKKILETVRSCLHDDVPSQALVFLQPKIISRDCRCRVRQFCDGCYAVSQAHAQKASAARTAEQPPVVTSTSVVSPGEAIRIFTGAPMRKAQTRFVMQKTSRVTATRLS